MRLLQILFGRNDNKGVSYNLRFESFHGLKATKEAKSTKTTHPLDGMVRKGDFASRLWFEWAIPKSPNHEVSEYNVYVAIGQNCGALDLPWLAAREYVLCTFVLILCMH